MRLRRLLLVGLILMSVSLAVGTGGFSSMTAERPVNVNVVSDAEAYIAVSDTTLQCGNPPMNTIFYNQFSEDLETVTLTVTVPATETGTIQLKPKGGGKPTTLHSGASTTITVGPVAVGEGPRLQITPNGHPTPGQLTIGIDATAPGLSAVVDSRSYNLSCPRN